MKPPSIEQINAARQRLQGLAVRTPLLCLNAPEFEGSIYLKLENLQPIGSFKIRGAASCMGALSAKQLRHGVYTASAGNMAQGVAFVARQMQIPCAVVVPDHAPRTKLEAIERLGGRTLAVPFAEWWDILCQGGTDKLPGHFIHPVSDPAVIAGNASIGVEIVEDLDDFDAVVAPYGGGGLSCGIAAALKHHKPEVPVYAAEVATAAPLSASLRAGKPVTIDYEASFVDGIGGKSLLTEMWPLVQELLKDSIVVTLEQVSQSLRLLLERARIVAEGAGAVSLAAALNGKAGGGRIVCVVSGGNIDLDKLFDVVTTAGPPPSSRTA